MREIIFAEDIFTTAAEKFIELANHSITERGIFFVALSGGSTPKKLYELLASERFSSQINWEKIHFFFGDERFVPVDSLESNFRMINDAMFSKVKIPKENIHCFNTENGNAESSAIEMENRIRSLFILNSEDFPRFDLIFLGMGTDGHTASLFPETAALGEKKRIVIENYVPKFETFRLTFTFPTINNARNIIFLVSGEEKAEMLNRVLEGDFQSQTLPSQMVCPTDGRLIFLTDVGIK